MLMDAQTDFEQWTMGAFVFYKAEKNQQWTYFESLYFSYTTLLTIGYGDFEPMSNSGKSFFVFWSLLAVPTLTILISNMGDTVVQWVKDCTIWLGEVTVLPSDDARTFDRLRYGIYKSIFGAEAARKQRDEELKQKSRADTADDEDEEQPRLEEPPGRILGRRVFRARHKKQTKADQRLAANFEKAEATEEASAKKHGNKVAENEHHYRRLLLSEIRKVYADSAASQPKHYTYEEWTYYIELLGQDENDSQYHRQPTAADDAPGSHSANDRHINDRPEHRDGDPQGANLPDNSPTEDKGPPATQWSWIGQKSPLIGDKDEPEWLLEKLFAKLEESLQKKIPSEVDQPCSRDRAPSTLERSTPQSTSSGPSVTPRTTSERSGN